MAVNNVFHSQGRPLGHERLGRGADHEATRMDPVDRAWATPEAAEKAFYESFEAGDLPTMMQVWADTSDICCIHPMGKALRGHARP